MATLKELLNKPGVKLEEVTTYIDSLQHPERVQQVRDLGRKEQEVMWAISENSKKIDYDYLMPPDAKPFEVFPFEGKNSLPLFTKFQKVFYKDNQGRICGYNNAWIGWLVGPGYYVTRKNPKNEEFELQVDYTQIPDEKPESWPEIKSNDIFPTNFVYGGTRDNLRWVSKDVLIGRAFKMGEDPMPNWFVLCRAQPAKG